MGDPNEHMAGSHLCISISIFNIYTEMDDGDDDDASSCCWKWWKAIRSFLVRSAVVGPVGFVLLPFRLLIPGAGAVANIVGLYKRKRRRRIVFDLNYNHIKKRQS